MRTGQGVRTTPATRGPRDSRPRIDDDLPDLGAIKPPATRQTQGVESVAGALEPEPVGDHGLGVGAEPFDDHERSPEGVWGVAGGGDHPRIAREDLLVGVDLCAADVAEMAKLDERASASQVAESLRQRRGDPRALDDMVESAALRRCLENRLPPVAGVRKLLDVKDGVGAELAADVKPALRAADCRDPACASGGRDCDCEHPDGTGALHKDRIAELEASAEESLDGRRGWLGEHDVL